MDIVGGELNDVDRWPTDDALNKCHGVWFVNRGARVQFDSTLAQKDLTDARAFWSKPDADADKAVVAAIKAGSMTVDQAALLRCWTGSRVC